MSDAPAWLAALQQQWGTLVRTPLDRSRGHLYAETKTYPAEVCAAIDPGPHAGVHERLAIYHRQYWFRLFGMLQQEYRLTARLLGMWQFNALAARYLTAHPPNAYDLQHASHRFVEHLATTLPATGHAGVARELLCEAARLDATFSRVFLAPPVTLLEPAHLSGPSLPTRQLRLAPTVALFRERWPLVALRNALFSDGAETQVPAPTLRAQPGHFVIFRVDDGQQVAELDPLAHRLFTLLSQTTVAEALATLEAECDATTRAQLPQRVQRWLRESMRVGFWLADPA